MDVRLRPATESDRNLLYSVYCQTMREIVERTWGWDERWQLVARHHGIDVNQSFVIGDSPDDVRAAKRLGAKGCLVRTGWARDPQVVETAAPDAAVVVESLAAAVDWILIPNA